MTSGTASSTPTFALQGSQKETERAENIFEEIIKFSILGEETDIQAQETQKAPNKINSKRSTSRQVIKMSKFKDKEGNLQSRKSKATSHIKGNTPKNHQLIFQHKLFRSQGRGIYSKCFKKNYKQEYST